MQVDASSNAAPEYAETVVIIDDEEGNRMAFEEILNSIAIPSRSYGSADEFLNSDPKHDIGCFLLDLRMPGISGLELYRQLVVDGYIQPVIFVTGYSEVSVAIEAMKEGAYDFIQKPVGTQNLIDVVQSALRDHHAISEIKKRNEFVNQCFASLTDREQEVFELVVQGDRNRRIAQKLDITDKTVEAHRANMMRKMQANSVPDLVRKSFLLEQKER